MNPTVRKAIESNGWLSRYVLAANHAFLWIAALSLAGFAHLSPLFTPHQALLISTLVAYGAYLCESGLNTWRIAASQSFVYMNFRKAALWRWVWLNAFTNTIISVIFLLYPSTIWIVAVIAIAGWQKYMDGRVGPRLLATKINLVNNVFISKSI